MNETKTLDQLQKGQSAIITELKSEGMNRRRMMDLGMLPGTHIEIEMISPLGNPVAYRIRGAVIALRNKQAQKIEIELETELEN